MLKLIFIDLILCFSEKDKNMGFSEKDEQIGLFSQWDAAACLQPPCIRLCYQLLYLGPYTYSAAEAIPEEFRRINVDFSRPEPDGSSLGMVGA